VVSGASRSGSRQSCGAACVARAAGCVALDSVSRLVVARLFGPRRCVAVRVPGRAQRRVPGSRIFYRYGVFAASAPKADSLRSRGIRYSNDGVAESAFFCNAKISDLHSPHSGRDRWTVAAQNTGSRFLSRARILEIRNARARELLESKHARFLPARKQTSGSVSTSPERAGLALSRLELPTVVCAGFSHSLSRT
jgi:hypothetical protein